MYQLVRTTANQLYIDTNNQRIYSDMKQYLTTEDQFIDITWFEAENKTKIIMTLCLTNDKYFYLDSYDYLNNEEFEEDKEFIL